MYFIIYYIFPYLFILLTILGIPIEGPKAPLPPYYNKELNDAAIIEQYFSFLDSHLVNGVIKRSHLSLYLQNDDILELLELIQIARVFCLYILGYIFFPNAFNSCQIGWLRYVIDMGIVGNYDWGQQYYRGYILFLMLHVEERLKA